ncbi:MAG: phage tail tape measure protein [Cohnella sp.]|nr:phage tail tape measure protein [Cohnella sp.]
MAEQQAKRSLRSEIKLEFNDFITLADSLAASLEAMETAAEELHDELNQKALFHDIQKAAKAIKSGIVDMGGIDFAMFKDRLETQVSQALMSSKLTLTGLDQPLDIAFNRSAMNAGLEEVFAKISIGLDKQLRIILSHIQNIVTAPQSIGFDGPAIRRRRNVMPAVVRRAPQSKAEFESMNAIERAAMERNLAEFLQRFTLRHGEGGTSRDVAFQSPSDIDAVNKATGASQLSVGYKDNPAAVQQDMGKKLDAAVQQGKGVSPTFLADTLMDIAGSISGLPMDALGPAFEAYQDYESSMVKAKMNFESKDPTYTQVAGRRVENLYARGFITADDYNNNYAALVESQRNTLKKEASGGIRDDLNKLAYLNGVGTVDAASAFQLASQKYDDPKEALEITRQVLKAKSIEDLDVQPASEGLAAVASQWGLQTQELEKVMNMAIKTAHISHASLQDLLEMQSKAGAVFRGVTPNLSAKDKEAAIASSLGLSSFMMESTAQSSKQGGAFFESFLDNLYAPKSVDLFDELQQHPSLNGLKLSPYEDDGKGGKKTRDSADVFGALVDASDMLDKQNRSSVMEPLIQQLFAGQASSFDDFLGDFKEQAAKQLAAMEILRRNGATGADGLPIVKPTGPNGTISTADIIKFRNKDIQATDRDSILSIQAAQMDTYKYKGQQVATMFETATGKVFEELKDEFATLATYLNGFLRVVSNNAGLVSHALSALTLVGSAFAARRLGGLVKEKAGNLASKGRAEHVNALRRDFNTQASHLNLRRTVIEGTLDRAYATGGQAAYDQQYRRLSPEIAKVSAESHMLNERMKLLDGEVEKLGIHESHLTVQTRQVQKEFRNAAVDAQQYQRALTNIATTAGVAEKDLDKLRRKVAQAQRLHSKGKISNENYNQLMHKYETQINTMNAGVNPVHGNNKLSTVANIANAAGSAETKESLNKVAAKGKKTEGMLSGLSALAGGMKGLGWGALASAGVAIGAGWVGRALTNKNEMKSIELENAAKISIAMQNAQDTNNSLWKRSVSFLASGTKFLWDEATGKDDFKALKEAKADALREEHDTSPEAIQRAVARLTLKNNVKMLEEQYNLDPTLPWMTDIKGNIVEGTARYKNITTTSEAQQLMQRQDEKTQRELSNAQEKYAVNRAKALMQGFNEDSSVITEMTSKFLQEQIGILDADQVELDKRMKEFEVQNGDTSAEFYKYLQSRKIGNESQIVQLKLQEYQSTQQANVKRVNNLNSLFDFKREKTDIAYRSKLADALLGGAPEDGKVAEEINKQALLAQNAEIAAMIPQLRAELNPGFDPNNEKETAENRDIWLQIAQLELEQKENLVKIKEAVTNKMSTFNLPSGISPMTYYESVTEQGTHKNMSLIKGDTVINLTVNGDVGSEDTLRRISEAVEAAANNPYEQAARGMADGVKRISAAPFSPIGGGTM